MLLLNKTLLEVKCFILEYISVRNTDNGPHQTTEPQSSGTEVVEAKPKRTPKTLKQ